MATYIYETVEKPHTQFEFRQSMKDDAFTHHPETGVAIRRVISGGYGIMQKAGKPVPKKMRRGHSCCGGGCGGGCGCH